MDWMTTTWMRPLDSLEWPFYSWLRDRHLAAVAALEAAQGRHTDLLQAFADEDRRVAEHTATEMREQRARIEVALREGEEPPPEEPLVERDPETGPVRRRLELNLAAEQVSAATIEVHRAAASILIALPQFLWELDEAFAASDARLGAEYVERQTETIGREVALRERFHSEQTTQGLGSVERCQHCSLEATWLKRANWGSAPERSMLQADVDAVRRWLIGRPPTGTPEEMRRWHRALEGQESTTWPFALALRRIKGECAEAAERWDAELVLERPADVPSSEGAESLVPEGREALFAERLDGFAKAETAVAV